MIIVALPDIHGKYDRLEAIGDKLRDADVVLLPGDLTMFGERKAAEAVVGAVRKYNENIYAVMGNCDYPEVEAYLKEEGMCLHLSHTMVDGIALVGLGGSLPCPFPTLNEWSEEEIAGMLESAAKDVPEDADIVLVCHQPPKDTVVDLAAVGQHVGSATVRSFIEKRKPLVCFSGHIHEARGVDAIGDAKLINPGPLREGFYAHANIGPAGVSVEVRTVPSHG